MDAYDKILQKLGERMEEWDEASREAINADASFKQFEAASKKAYMDAGESAVRAEAEIRSTEAWRDQYANLKLLEHKANKLKKQMDLGEMYWETERSRQASLRRVGI